MGEEEQHFVQAVVVLKIEEDYPVFGKIENIYISDSNIIHFHIKSLSTVQYNTHYHAYFVKVTQTFSTVCLTSLYSVFPLTLRKLSTNEYYTLCVVVKHHIPGSVQI